MVTQRSHTLIFTTAKASNLFPSSYTQSLGLRLGKSWACKHWKIKHIYFVILVSFCCHFFVIQVCHFGFALSFVCHLFVILRSFCCHLFVILLSFWKGKWKKILRKWLPWQTFCYLVAAPKTRNKCRNSWKASRRWRRIGQGACLDEELSPGWGAGPAQKPGGGPGGGQARGPGNSKNAALPARESFFCILFAFSFVFFKHLFFAFFFAFPRLGVIFWACFLHFPNRESFFCIFFAFPRPGLPPSPLAGSGWENDKNMSRFWTFQLGSGSSHPRWMRKRQENDKQMTPKWQQNGRKMTKKWQTNDTAKQEWQKNDKTKRQKKTKK